MAESGVIQNGYIFYEPISVKARRESSSDVLGRRVIPKKEPRKSADAVRRAVTDEMEQESLRTAAEKRAGARPGTLALSRGDIPKVNETLAKSLIENAIKSKTFLFSPEQGIPKLNLVYGGGKTTPFVPVSFGKDEEDVDVKNVKKVLLGTQEMLDWRDGSMTEFLVVKFYGGLYYDEEGDVDSFLTVHFLFDPPRLSFLSPTCCAMVLELFYFAIPREISNSLKKEYPPNVTMANLCLLADALGIPILIPDDVTRKESEYNSYYRQFGFLNTKNRYSGKKKWYDAERKPCPSAIFDFLSGCRDMSAAQCDRRIEEALQKTQMTLADVMRTSCYFLSQDYVYPLQKLPS